MKHWSASNVVAVLAALGVGVTFGPDDSPPPVPPQVDSVAPQRLVEEVRGLRLENDGLRARLESREARQPRTIVRTDTVYQRLPPDTVYEALRVEGGRLSTGLLFRRDSVWVPELHRNIDVSDCDEGWSMAAGEVVCDRARFGHLFLGGELALRPWVGVWWEPSYRSAWSVHVGYTGRQDQPWTLGVRGGWQVF